MAEAFDLGAEAIHFFFEEGELLIFLSDLPVVSVGLVEVILAKFLEVAGKPVDFGFAVLKGIAQARDSGLEGVDAIW